MGVRRVGGGEGIAVERGAQAHRANLVLDLERLDGQVDTGFDGELALGADDGRACSCRTGRTGSNKMPGVEDENPRPRLGKRQLDGGKAAGRVEGAAAPRGNGAYVQRQRHIGTGRGNGLGERDDVDHPRHVVQEFAVGVQGVVVRMARQMQKLAVADEAVVVLALALALGLARVERLVEEVGERCGLGVALGFLRLPAQAIFNVDGGVDVGAQTAQPRSVRHGAVRGGGAPRSARAGCLLGRRRL